MITKEEFMFLNQFQDDFSRVLDSQYKLPTPMDRDEKILTIVRKYEPKFSFKWGCSQCSFSLYERAGMLYRNYVPEVKPKGRQKKETK